MDSLCPLYPKVDEYEQIPGRDAILLSLQDLPPTNLFLDLRT